MAEVRVIDDQIEKALKILKRKLAQDGTFKEVKRRRFYEKPSVKKKRKRQEAQKRRIKALKKSRRPASKRAWVERDSLKNHGIRRKLSRPGLTKAAILFRDKSNNKRLLYGACLRI